MKFPRCTTIVTCLLIGFSASFSTAVGALTPESPPDRTPLLRILDDENAAWEKGDADAFAGHVRDDVVFTNIVGMFSVGKIPFVAQHKSIFATIYKKSVVKQFVQNISFVRSDMAIVDTVAALSGAREVPTGASTVDGVLYTRLEQVMVNDNGTWKVASFHNVTIQPKFVDQKVRLLTEADAH